MINPTQEKTNIENGAILSPLGEIELETCRLRFEGHTSREIQSLLTRCYGERAPREKTIRNWFYCGGKLYEFYKSYAEEESKVRNLMARQIFQAHIKNAARTVVQIMSDSRQPGSVRLKAAEYIINREFGMSPKIITDSENHKDPTQRILEEMGII